MVIARGAVFYVLIFRFIHSKHFYALIHAIYEYLFHIVMSRLTKVYSVKLGIIAKDIDIVVASAAEVHTSAVKAVKQDGIVGLGKLAIEVGG